MFRSVYIKYFLFLLVILFGPGCKKNSFHVPVSNISLDLKIHRFEKDLFNMQLANPESAVDSLQEKYGRFLSFFGYVIHIGETGDPRFAGFLVQFVTDRVNNEVYQEVLKEFPDTRILKKKINNAFKHYLYYFPDKTVPQVYTFVSGFNTSLIIDTNILGIGLDRYLGADYPYYQDLGIPRYMRRKMTPGKIPSDCMYAWGQTEFEFNKSTEKEIPENVLNQILYEGKLMYFVKSMLPDEDDAVIMGFTPQQMKWCEDNELDMWTYLVEHKLLFKTDRMTLKKLTGEAPFTSLFPRKSPGRAAVWLGFRIVSAYMNQHREVNLKTLMQESDYQKILNEAKYDPK